MKSRRKVCNFMKKERFRFARVGGRTSISLRFNTVVLSCFVLIAAFLGLLYHQFQKVLLESINNLNTEFVAQVSATSGFAEEFLQNMANQIFYTHSVSKLRSYQELTNQQVIEGIRELNSFAASSTIIDSIYIFNGKQDYVYSTSSTGAVSDATDSFADQAAVELFGRRNAAQRLVPIPRYSRSANRSSNRELYSFLFFELDSSGTPRDNAIMFNISKNWFTKLYFSNDPGNRAFIVSGEKELIALQNGLSTDECQSLSDRVLPMAQQGDDSGYFVYTAQNGEKSLCFFSVMGSHDWYYVKTVGYDQCLSDLKDIEKEAMIFLAVGFAILFAGGAIISLNIYLPFQQVANRLSLIEPGASQDTSLLLDSLNRLIETSSSADRVRDSLQAMVRGEVLEGLLQGSRQFENPAALIGEYDLNLTGDAPLMLCLASGLRMPQYLECARETIPYREGVVIQNEYTVLFLQPTDPASLSPVLQQLCARYPSVWFIISPEITDWQMLPQAYEKLLETFHLRFLFPREKLLFSETFGELDNSSAVLEQKIDPILSALKKGYGNKTIEAYQDFVACFAGQSYRSISYALTALSNAVFKLYFEVFPNQDRSYEAACRDFEQQLNTLVDIETLNRTFEELFTQIAEQLQKERQAKRGNAMEEIMETIQECYCDPNLSSQSLADRFGLSSAYLCRLFRQVNGCSLMDYINQLRMAKAQEILSDPSVKVKDVPEQIGIENKQYFFMLFKQTTGQTPKQFQTALQEKESAALV